METIARSSEQYARARCRRNGEREPSNNKTGLMIAQHRDKIIPQKSLEGEEIVSPVH
jgi:hypothetical protein